MLKSEECSIVLSSVVFAELDDCKEPKKSFALDRIGEIIYEFIFADKDIVALAGEFVDFGILTSKSGNDCRHIAAALISGCDVIVS